MAISSVTLENLLLWAFLMQNFNLGIAKMSVTSENPVISESVTSENLCNLNNPRYNEPGYAEFPVIMNFEF